MWEKATANTIRTAYVLHIYCKLSPRVIAIKGGTLTLIGFLLGSLLSRIFFPMWEQQKIRVFPLSVVSRKFPSFSVGDNRQIAHSSNLTDRGELRGQNLSLKMVQFLNSKEETKISLNRWVHNDGTPKFHIWKSHQNVLLNSNHTDGCRNSVERYFHDW